MRKTPHDEFLQKTAEARIRKIAGDSTIVHLEQLDFPTLDGEDRPFRRATIMTEREGLSFYASGSFEPALEEAIDKTMEELEGVLETFKEAGEAKELIPHLLREHLAARVMFENPEENWDLSTKGLERTARAIRGYKTAEEALRISNAMTLEEIRIRTG